MKRKHLPSSTSSSAKLKWLCLFIALVAISRSKLLANPQGMTVVSGSASAQTSGSQLNVTVGQNAFLNWSSFNIQPSETTRFIQPTSDSIVLNRINDSNPSQIWGNLTANGSVILANAHGFYFGPNSMIQVGGSFVATTAPITPDFGADSAWQFTGMPPLASIVNYGSITVGEKKSLFLIAERAENHGELSTQGGSIGLIAGKEVLLSERPDGRGLSATVQLPSGSIDNSGRIIADAGTIALQAQVVNQSGILQANSVREQNGIIELIASESVNLAENSSIRANGESTQASSGGKIVIRSDGTFSDAAGSSIEIKGGANGGNGGFAEISAPVLTEIHSTINGSAQIGFQGGAALIDPVDLTLNGSSLTPFVGLSEILFQATHNITLAAGTSWNLSAATGISDGTLTLQAGNNIVFGNNAKITDANNWLVKLQAGYDFNSENVQSGVGSIFLNGGSGLNLSGAIETSRGSIDLTAGDSVLVGLGYIRTVGGGDIHVRALSGDVNAGKNNGNYSFTANGYSIDPAGLGGIATGAGGNITLEAGRDIISVPTVPTSGTSANRPGASGAYGSAPGDVTLIAGHQIRGNFLVRNGTGLLLSGVQVVDGQVTQILNPLADIGSASDPVSLSLISGSWNAWAAHNIYIREVRNPNGTFNNNRQNVPSGAFAGNLDGSVVPAKTAFLFDYALDAAANFWAGNSIVLDGSNLPRITGQNTSMPPIYPPILTLNAGAGGIEVLNSIVLFPSSHGGLEITTRDGGNLSSPFKKDKLIGITMSDSGLPGWATFGDGHAITPLHLSDTDPVKLDISGGIERFGLTVPTFAEINVAGDTYNFGFLGRNLSPSQTTTINVSGDIRYRGNLTSVSLAGGFPEAVLNADLSLNPLVTRNLRYDSTTGTLTYAGQMTDADLAILLNPQVYSVDPFGRPLDADGQLTELSGKEQAIISIQLTQAQIAALQTLKIDSESASLGDNGLQLAGPGTFRVNARNIDLGVSQGIGVRVPDAGLEAITPYGANLEVNASGNLLMTSTKISDESYRGGIALTVGGTLDVGGQFTTFGDASAPKGIFTTGGGSISVSVNGNVNVNGSRIAAYNGGNIQIISAHGDVNAGSGGAGYVSMNALELDPLTGKLVSLPASIPGSGILATTLPGSLASLGNITVAAPEGSINASVGGIIQIAFNGADTRENFVDLNAGNDINAGGSGIIGSNIRLHAGGDINGVIVGSRNVNIDSQQNVNVTAFGGSGISISAAGTVAGTVIGGGNVSVSGDSISAALISKSVSSSGDSSEAAVGLPQNNVSKSDAQTAEDASTSLAKSDNKEDDEEQKKKNKPITLAQKVGRVTVILPNQPKGNL